MKWQSGTITAIVPRSRLVKSFFFDLAEPFDFVAGQHVDIRLNAPDGYRAQRSYSIASAPGEAGPLELAIERLDSGEVSPFFHDVAEVGDAIDLRRPIGGHFVWRVGDGGPLLLIGGGSGVVPLLSMVRHRALSRSTVPVALILSVRSRDDLLFGEELAKLAANADGFALTVTVTRDPDAPQPFVTRRIDGAMVGDALSRLPSTPAGVYICGSNAFVSAAADAVQVAGIPAELIRTERYGE